MHTLGHRLLFAVSIIMLTSALFPHASTAADSAAPIDVVEARRNVTSAWNATESMLSTLQRLDAINAACPPELLTQFKTNAHRLQVDSFILRARAQAMQSRGNVYFQQWQEHLTNANNPEVRRFAKEHRQSLEHSFRVIKERSEKAAETLQLFISDIQTLRRALERNPSSNVTNFSKDLIKAGDDGRKVRQNLTGIRDEWNTVTSNLTPTGSPQR